MAQGPIFFKLLGNLGRVAELWTADTDPSKRLWKRLETASTHVRTTYGQHLKQQDEMSDHCLLCLLGHSCNRHLNTDCDHRNTVGQFPPHPRPWSEAPSTAGSRSLGGRWDANCEVCDIRCSTSGGRTVSSLSWKCKYCCHSVCNDCFRDYFPDQGPDEDFVADKEYVCKQCSSDIIMSNHRVGGCAPCEELLHLPVDIMSAIHKVEKVVGSEASKKLQFQGERLINNFNNFKHHMVRVAQQELRWPSLLKEMRDLKQYHRVAIKSDNWKKYRGACLKNKLCGERPQQSVETHCCWFLLPPSDMPGVDWSVLPPGSRDLPKDKNGFRGFVVENHTQVSDITIQNSHQSNSDFTSLLHTLKARHSRLTDADRDSDGASSTYNNKATSVVMAEMGRVTGIRVNTHSHNAPGHGADQPDSVGANCCRAIYAWMLLHDVPVNHARQTVKALQQSLGLKGGIFSMVEHDPSQFLDPALIPNLLLKTRTTLYKEYKYLTTNMDEVASLIQHRFFNIGEGYTSSAEFLKTAMNSHTYKTKTLTVITDVGAGDQVPT